MTNSLLSAHATDGSDLFAVVSVSAIRSLTSAQIQALGALGIRRISELLHFQPIHDARLIVAAARGQIAHNESLADLLDTEFRDVAAADLPSKKVAALRTIGNPTASILKDAFGITTIQELAGFKAFEEAQQFLTPAEDVFREPASAPSELMPKIVGAVQSTATYSSFVKDQTLRLRGVELTYDNNRVFFVDPVLAGIFPVQGIELIRRQSLFNFKPILPIRIPEPVIKLGYVCKHTQEWVNFGTFLGEMVFSLALAPGESRNIAVVDWTRSQRTRRGEDTTASEQLTNELFHVRALDEVTRSAADEHQRGGTTIEAGTLSTAAAGVIGAGIAGGIAGTIPGAAIGAAAGAIAGTIEPGLGNAVGAVAGAAAGAVIGFGLGAAVAGGAALVGAANAQIGTLRSDSSGNRAIEGSLRQTISETVKQKASSVRSLRSNIFVTDDQAEQEHLQTRNITNYNHSHMLNLEYFEVLQHYRVELRLTEAEPLLFLPFRPLDFTLDLIRTYWSTLRTGVFPRSMRQEFDQLIDGIESGSSSTEPQKLRSVTVRLALSPFLGAVPIQVALTGQPDVQQTRTLVPSGFGSFGSVLSTGELSASFSFKDPIPSTADLTGVSVTGLLDPSVGVAVLIQAEDSNGRVFRYELGDSPIRPTDGIVNLPLSVGPTPDSSANAIDKMERYFDERRYFFTRLLLLAIEKEQLIDLVEALQFQTSIETPFPGDFTFPVIPLPGFTGVPDRGALTPPGFLALGGPASSRTAAQPNAIHFASGQARVASAAVDDLTNRVRDRVRDAVIARIPERNRAAGEAAISAAVDHALSLVRSQLRGSPPLDAASIDESTKAGVETIRKALTTTAGLTDRQAIEVLKATNLAEELKGSLKTAIKIPGILAVSVHLTEFIEPEPLAITGNTLVFRMKRVTDNDVLKNALVTGKLKPLSDQPSAIEDFVAAGKDVVTSHDVDLPTTGVFAEAILGRANASEKLDITRFTNWQDSPIPNLAPRIADLQAGGRAQPPLEAVPTVPGSVLNIVNPPAFPDPTGLAASLAAVQNGNIFRDLSNANVLAGVLGNLSNLANQQGQLAGNLAGDAQKEALQSAVAFGNKIADLTGQALQAQQQPSAPQTQTEKGALINEAAKTDAAASDGGGINGGSPRRSNREDVLRQSAGLPPRAPEASDRPVSFQFQFVDLDGAPMSGGVGITLSPDFGASIPLADPSNPDHTLDNSGFFIDFGTVKAGVNGGQANLRLRVPADDGSVLFELAGSARFTISPSNVVAFRVTIASEAVEVTSTNEQKARRDVIEQDTRTLDASGELGGDLSGEAGEDSVIGSDDLIKLGENALAKIALALKAHLGYSRAKSKSVESEVSSTGTVELKFTVKRMQFALALTQVSV
jgi:hypothetical protein